MQKVLRGRSASICNVLKRRSKVSPFFRSLSKAALPDNEEVLDKQIPSNPEPLFGIPPRKLRNEEDDDFYPTTAPGPTTTFRKNYFSQAWAAQKQTSLSNSAELVSDHEQEHRALSRASTTLKVLPVRERWPHRVWLDANPQASVQETFTFASLKVLSTEVVKHHQQQLYCYAPNSVLVWKSRRQKVVAELDVCCADVICLQEVDQFEDLKSDLSNRGYEGLYKVSTGKAYDGCAIFWKKNRFKMLYEKSLEFSKLDLRDNVAQLCVFQLLSPRSSSTEAALGDPHVGSSKHLIVGNIDLLFNPKRGEIKLGQCRAFLNEVHELSRAWPGAPVVIGGCFQFTPQSALYKFVAESELDISGFSRSTLSGQPHGKRAKVTEKLRAYNLQSGDGMDPLNARLKKSLMAGITAQRQERQGVQFAALAKELLSIPPSADGSIPSNAAPGAQLPKEGYTRASELVSKTIEILKSSIPAPRAENSTTTPDLVPNVMMKSGDAMEETNASSKPMEPTEVVESDNTGTTGRESTTGAQSMSQEQGWDIEELKVATGKEDSTVVKHELKLFSVYPEIPGRPDTRDDKGEPLVTMYHKDFRGTVDYIWRSEGLKTAKVYDSVPLRHIQALPGLPSQVYGSDHVSIACKLAFV